MSDPNPLRVVFRPRPLWTEDKQKMLGSAYQASADSVSNILTYQRDKKHASNVTSIRLVMDVLGVQVKP